MDRPFIYDRYVTGKSFVGRKTDCVILGNLLSAGEHVVLYEPPKSGKMSVIQQTLYNMRAAGRQFSVVRVNMFNIRTIEQFLVRFGTSVIRPMYSTAEEYASVVERYLGGTHFVFDRDVFAASDEVVSLNWSTDASDMEAMMRLPFRIAEEKGQSIFVILEEFQNLMMDKNHEDMFKALERVFSEGNRLATFIVTGSQVNAMKYIFAEKKFFYRQIEHLPLQKVDNMEISEHIVKGFMVSGKVLDRELA